MTKYRYTSTGKARKSCKILADLLQLSSGEMTDVEDNVESACLLGLANSQPTPGNRDCNYQSIKSFLFCFVYR
jgi:hypothetical protein